MTTEAKSLHSAKRGTLTTTANPVVFLDFDGVLVHTGNFRTACPDCIAQLNRVTGMTGADIVVSSSWRDEKNPNEVVEHLRKWGATARVIGQTPRLDRKEENIWVSVSRGTEIQAWLRANPKIERFVILDDDRDLGTLMAYLVQTVFLEGLTPAKADDAIRRLQS